MRAVFIHGERDVRIGALPDPEPKPDEYLLKVASVCVCGSDLHYYVEGRLGTRLIGEPQVPCHEVSAWIWDERAAELGLEFGQLVAVEPSRFCGDCEYCKGGRPNLCRSVRFCGAPPNQGVLAEYITAPKEAIIPVPEDFTPETVTALEPIGIGIHAMKKADLQLADSVAVLGCGPIGLILLQLARAGGAGRIYAVDPIADRAKKARTLGADEAGDSFERVLEWTEGKGVDLVLEATTSPDAFAEAGALVKPAGRIVLVGIPAGVNYSAMDAMPFRSKEPTVKICNRMGEVFHEAIEMVTRGHVDVDALVTHRGTFDDAVEIFERQAAYRDGAIKTAVFPHGLPE